MKQRWDGVFLCLKINIQVFYKLILVILVDMVRYSQIAYQIVEFLEGQYLK